MHNQRPGRLCGPAWYAQLNIVYVWLHMLHECRATALWQEMQFPVSHRPFQHPSAGHVLLAFDYSQVELRMLAHISGQGTLTDVLQQGDDAFALIAARWLNAGGRHSTWGLSESSF